MAESMKYTELIDLLENELNRQVTHTELAKVLGCGRANVSKKANATNSSEVTVTELLKIQEYYKVDLIKKESDNKDKFIITVPHNAKNIIVKITHGQSVRVEVI